MVSVPSVLIVAALLLSFAGAAAAQFMPGNADQVRRITVAELKRLMDEGEVIVLDVRTPWEFEAGHIPGSRFVPLSRVDQQAAELRAERKPIVTYCT